MSVDDEIFDLEIGSEKTNPWLMPTSDQMELELYGKAPTPGNCPHEMYVLDPDSDSPKSECDLSFKTLGHSTWTTCREHGVCTLWRYCRG